MPKLKTKRSASKRFRITGSGRVKRANAHLRHILTKKTTKRKRNMRGMQTVHPSDRKAVRTMMPNAS